MTADWAKLPVRRARQDQQPHRQRGPGRQPRRVRHQLQAAGHDRVGVTPRRYRVAPRTDGVFRTRGRAVAFRAWSTTRQSGERAGSYPSARGAPRRTRAIPRPARRAAPRWRSMPATDASLPGLTAIDTAAIVRAKEPIRSRATACCRGSAATTATTRRSRGDAGRPGAARRRGSPRDAPARTRGGGRQPPGRGRRHRRRRGRRRPAMLVTAPVGGRRPTSRDAERCRRSLPGRRADRADRRPIRPTTRARPA